VGKIARIDERAGGGLTDSALKVSWQLAGKNAGSRNSVYSADISVI
jgi:hypothetical protein